jgi:hypothetical protein
MSYNLRLSRLLRFLFAFSCSTLLAACVADAADTPTPIAASAPLAPNKVQAAPASPAAVPAPANTPTDAVGTADGHSENTVEIRGLRHPDDIPYSSFVAAMRAFDENHHYAPDASLLFSVRNHDGKFDGMRISITGEQMSIPVPLDANGRFTLPIRQDALDDKAYVQANQHTGEVNWGTLVRTPGLPDDTLRLGDLRLDCRVDYALSRAETSLWVATIFRLAGGCNSDGHTMRELKRPGMRVKLTYMDREEVLPEKYYMVHHTMWAMPLADGNWPDDTLVQFLEPDSNFLLDKECADKLQRDAKEPYRHGSSTISVNDCVYRPLED